MQRRSASIKFRIPLAFAAVAVYVCLLAGYAAWALVDTIHAAARHQAEQIAEVVSYEVRDDVVNGDLQALQTFVGRLHRVYGRDVEIVDRHKTVLAHADPSQIGVNYREDPQDQVAQTLSDGRVRHFIEHTPNLINGLRHVVVPLWQAASLQNPGRVIGGVILEYSNVFDASVTKAREKLAWLAAAALLCVLLSIGTSLLIARRIVRPIAALSDAVEGYAAGRLATRVRSDRADEIGILGRKFNDMADQIERAHSALKLNERRLQDAAGELTLVGRMDGFLHACRSIEEASRVVSESARELFGKASGALYLTNHSRNQLKAHAAWGEASPQTSGFAPQDCWALRRGQTHVVADDEPPCAHAANDGRTYLCQPLVAAGETLGIVHVLDGLAAGGDAGSAFASECARKARLLAEHVAPAIANLELQERLRSLSIRDPLTGAFNRRYMDEALAQELQRAKRGDYELGVIMLDIDHFKRFNDSYGHDGGDAVLKALGAFLRQGTRSTDLVCRYGGEEFAIVLSPTTREGARKRAERIRVDVAGLSVTHGGMSLGPVTLSLGLALFPADAEDADEVVKCADLALYQAKHGGRNRVVVFGEEGVPGAT